MAIARFPGRRDSDCSQLSFITDDCLLAKGIPLPRLPSDFLMKRFAGEAAASPWLSHLPSGLAGPTPVAALVSTCLGLRGRNHARYLERARSNGHGTSGARTNPDPVGFAYSNNYSLGILNIRD